MRGFVRQKLEDSPTALKTLEINCAFPGVRLTFKFKIRIVLILGFRIKLWECCSERYPWSYLGNTRPLCNPILPVTLASPMYGLHVLLPASSCITRSCSRSRYPRFLSKQPLPTRFHLLLSCQQILVRRLYSSPVALDHLPALRRYPKFQSTYGRAGLVRNGHHIRVFRTTSPDLLEPIVEYGKTTNIVYQTDEVFKHVPKSAAMVSKDRRGLAEPGQRQDTTPALAGEGAKSAKSAAQKIKDAETILMSILERNPLLEFVAVSSHCMVLFIQLRKYYHYRSRRAIQDLWSSNWTSRRGLTTTNWKQLSLPTRRPSKVWKSTVADRIKLLKFIAKSSWSHFP
ncbi:MAG: hypothetical protein J3R72DRAFT_418355 [Linnemannia gamsii]|nr:MAG: hypothetical protein J3R72DRAFT_418355 [Linnemannia gamsii]